MDKRLIGIARSTVGWSWGDAPFPHLTLQTMTGQALTLSHEWERVKSPN